MKAVAEEIVAQELPVQLAVLLIGVCPHQSRQLPANGERSGHQAFSPTVTIVDGNAEVLREHPRNIALAAAYASSDTYLHQSSVCSIRNCTDSGWMRTCETPAGTERRLSGRMESGSSINSS